MSIARKKIEHVQRPSTYLVGLIAAFQIGGNTAMGTTTACDGPWDGCNEGRKGHGWQEESRCANEHFSREVWLLALAVKLKL